MSITYCEEAKTETLHGMTILTLTSGDTKHRFILPFHATCRLFQEVARGVDEMCDSTRSASVIKFPKKRKAKARS